MKAVYNETWLHNLHVVRETKRWYKNHMLTVEQFSKISAAYPSRLYSPNIIIRIMLFLAALLALAGFTALMGLILLDNFREESSIGVLCLGYGIVSYIALDMLFIRSGRHYKSGVTEAFLYHATAFSVGGLILIFNGNVHASLIAGCIIFTLVAIRYLDMINTVLAICAFAGLLFYELYELGGWFQAVIPFAFILVFTSLYFVLRKARRIKRLSLWHNNLLVAECVSLLLIYFAGNYLVVRELSVNMMNLYLEEGQDIPFAFAFYMLTVLIPAAYLYFGITKKDIVLIRISLLLVALSAFTFKYYFSLGHPEISLTIAGALLLGVTIALLNYLKEMRNGYTRENLLSEKWGDANIEAFVISQTMGGNQVQQTEIDAGGGGHFSGGGSSDSF